MFSTRRRKPSSTLAAAFLIASTARRRRRRTTKSSPPELLSNEDDDDDLPSPSTLVFGSSLAPTASSKTPALVIRSLLIVVLVLLALGLAASLAGSGGRVWLQGLWRSDGCASPGAGGCWAINWGFDSGGRAAAAAIEGGDGGTTPVGPLGMLGVRGAAYGAVGGETLPSFGNAGGARVGEAAFRRPVKRDVLVYNASQRRVDGG